VTLEDEPIDELTFDRTFENAASGYYLFNDDVYLYPTPDADVLSGLDIYYIPRFTAVAALANAVTLPDELKGLLTEWVTLKCKARQEESPAQFAPIYGKLGDQINALMSKTNLGTGRRMHVPTHKFI